VLHLHCRCLSLKIAETQKARDESHSSGKGDMTASAEIANMIWYSGGSGCWAVLVDMHQSFLLNWFCLVAHYS